MAFEDSKESSVSLLEESPEREYSSDVFDARLLRERSPLRRPLLLHGSFLLVHILLLAFQIFLPSPFTYLLSSNSLIQSPANEAISYVAKQYHIEPKINSPYVGEPRPELDVAWNDLLANTNIRLSQADLDALDRTEGIALPDGGYLGIINVYHQLHCIKRLHHTLYPSHYWPDLSDEDQIMNRGHSEHCLDVLRQGIMCQGDTSLLTLKWVPWTKTPLANFSAPHQCVDWELLDGWAKEHSVPRIFEKGYIVHPTLGPSFPGGKTAHLGVLMDQD